MVGQERGIEKTVVHKSDNEVTSDTESRKRKKNHRSEQKT